MGKDLLQNQYDYKYCFTATLLLASAAVEHRTHPPYFIDSHTVTEPEQIDHYALT